jgi:hypothetical protein
MQTHTVDGVTFQITSEAVEDAERHYGINVVAFVTKAIQRHVANLPPPQKPTNARISLMRDPPTDDQYGIRLVVKFS